MRLAAMLSPMLSSMMLWPGLSSLLAAMPLLMLLPILGPRLSSLASMLLPILGPGLSSLLAPMLSSTFSPTLLPILGPKLSLLLSSMLLPILGPRLSSLLSSRLSPILGPRPSSLLASRLSCVLGPMRRRPRNIGSPRGGPRPPRGQRLAYTPDPDPPACTQMHGARKWFRYALIRYQDAGAF